MAATTLFLLVGITGGAALNNGVGRVPPMGWNSWNHFGCHPTEALVHEQAQAMVSTGMMAAGYAYVNIDDCWLLADRDPTTKRQVANPALFPSGMPALAAHVHGMGLKFGLYSARCKFTCQKFAGSLEPSFSQP